MIILSLPLASDVIGVEDLHSKGCHKIKARYHGLTSLQTSSAWCSFVFLPASTEPSFLSYVCRQWASAARQCRLPLPLLVLPSGNVISFPDSKTFQVPDGVRYHNSCGEWLLLSLDDNSCFLMNPWSSYSYYEDLVAEDCMYGRRR